MNPITAVPTKTSVYMSKYEFTKLVGFRAMQLANDIHQESSPHRQAEDDIIDGKLSWIIRRHLPSGNHEDCDVRALKIPTDIVNDRRFR